jgi:hypothetical protein
VAAVGLTICGTALRLGLPGAIPSVVVVAMLGALVTVAGAIALVTSREDPSTTAAE